MPKDRSLSFVLFATFIILSLPFADMAPVARPNTLHQEQGCSSMMSFLARILPQLSLPALPRCPSPASLVSPLHTVDKQNLG